MKKTKIEQRTENTFDAFFGDVDFDKEISMTRFRHDEGIQTSAQESFYPKADKYYDLFKKIFSFLPGVLLLHMIVPAFLVFGFHVGGLFWIASGIFMVWAGIGDLRNKKHLLLPLSVILVALIFSVPLAVLPRGPEDYYIYFYAGILPLLFITPILLKGYLKEN